MTPKTRLLAWMVLTVAAGFVIPAGYHARRAEREETRLTELLQQGRIARAAQVAEELTRLGRSVPGDLPAQVRALERAVVEPLPASAPAAVVVSRAEALAQLDRLAEAETTIRPVADFAPQGTVLLGTILQDQGRYSESDDWFRRAWIWQRGWARLNPARTVMGLAAIAGLSGGASAAHTATAAPDFCRQAIDGLAFNARRQGRFADSEQWYREGLFELPAAQAHFHFQLGLHYAEADRPAAAIEQFQEAARLDPKRYTSEVIRWTSRLRRDTFGCFLSRPSL